MNFNIGKEAYALRPWETFLNNKKYHIQHPIPLAVTASLAFQDPPKPPAERQVLELFNSKPELLDQNKPAASAAQIEAAILFKDRFSKSPRFPETIQQGAFLGDTTGVGKSRTIAILIAEFNEDQNFQEQKAVWVSCSKDLFSAARKELAAVKCQLPVFRFLSKDAGYEGHKIYSDYRDEGVLFTTYSALRSGTNCITELLKWLPDKYSGLVVLDESHTCKNRSVTGFVIKWLQKQLPYARFLYVTATVGSEVNHLWHMDRLGLWGYNAPFKNVKDFESKIEQWGMNGMELIANHLQKQGCFVSRQLDVKEIEFKQMEINLSDLDKLVWNQCTILWTQLLEHVKKMPQNLGKPGLANKRIREYWSKNQTFYQDLLITLTAKGIGEIAKKYSDDKYCFVVSMQTTGDEVLSKLNKADQKGKKRKNHVQMPVLPDEEFSLCRQLLRNTLKAFNIVPETKVRDMDWEKAKPSPGQVVAWLFPQIEKNLGRNPIDEVIFQLGGTESVAEISGRKWVHQKSSKEQRKNGLPRYYCSRRKDNTAKEMNYFQSGKKNAIIVTQKGATGISLHADKTCKNQKQRVHIILQTPWVPENAIQQIGRTNRANQVSAPIYIVLSSPIPGEYRFVQTFLERLSKLGAICHGERFSKGNITSGFKNPFYEAPHLATTATREFLRDVSDGKYKMGLKKEGQVEKPDFYTVCENLMMLPTQRKKNDFTVEQFLNRILGMTIDTQIDMMNALICKFNDVVYRNRHSMDKNIKEIPRSWTSTIKNRTSYGEGLKKVELLEVQADRGVSFQHLEVIIEERRKKFNTEPMFFTYLTKEIMCAFAATPDDEKNILVYSPWCCEVEHKVKEHYRKWVQVPFNKDGKMQIIRERWEQMHADGKKRRTCIHVYRGERKECNDTECRIATSGCRKVKVFLLTGCLLNIWETIREKFQPDNSGKDIGGKKRVPMQILRINAIDRINKTDKKEEKHIGIYVPDDLLPTVRESLASIYSDDQGSDYDKLEKEKLEKKSKTASQKRKASKKFDPDDDGGSKQEIFRKIRVYTKLDNALRNSQLKKMQTNARKRKRESVSSEESESELDSSSESNDSNSNSGSCSQSNSSSESDENSDSDSQADFASDSNSDSDSPSDSGSDSE